MPGCPPSTSIPRPRWRRLACSAVAVSVALATSAGCGSEAESGDTTPGGPTDEPSRLVVDLVPAVGIGPTASVISVGSTLVAQGFVWSDEPFQWSDDGVRWQPSQVPNIDRDALSESSLVTVDGLAVVFAGQQYGGPRVDPAIWVSEDGGRSFHAGTGIADGLQSADLTTVTSIDGTLVAFGRGTTTDGTEGPLRWTSADRGRTWSRTPVTGADDASGPYAEVAVHDTTLLTIATGTSGGYDPSQPPDERLLRSTDAGRTWSKISYDFEQDDDPETFDVVGQVEQVDGQFVVRSLQRTWISTDGTAWTPLGRAPAIADAEGELPDPLESGALDVVEVAGDRMLAWVRSFYNNEHELGHLATSDDGAPPGWPPISG